MAKIHYRGKDVSQGKHRRKNTDDGNFCDMTQLTSRGNKSTNLGQHSKQVLIPCLGKLKGIQDRSQVIGFLDLT